MSSWCQMDKFISKVQIELNIKNTEKWVFCARCEKPPMLSFLSEYFSLKSLLHWKSFKTLTELTLNVSSRRQVRQPAQTSGTMEAWRREFLILRARAVK